MIPVIGRLKYVTIKVFREFLKAKKHYVATLQMPSGDVMDAICRGTRDPCTSPGSLLSPLLQHSCCLQGMAQGTMHRHSEISLYWQRGELGERIGGVKGQGKSHGYVEQSHFLNKNLTHFKTHQICVLKVQRCRCIPDQSKSRRTTQL